jgi:putative toxin-antitoxin system antitoxin component (TIGR02293 family)
MASYNETATALGLQITREGSAFDLISHIEKGLSVAALDRISRALAPDDRAFKYRIVPRPTYVRRKKGRRLSFEESARLARLARIWAFAGEVWGGDEEARDFMFRSHPLLDDQRPIDLVIKGEIGARLVEEVLGRLAYGSAA